MSFEERGRGYVERAIQAGRFAQHDRHIQRHASVLQCRRSDCNADVVPALSVRHLYRRVVGRAGAVPAARYARTVVLRVLLLAVVEMKEMEMAAGRVASKVGVGERSHALQQCEGHQKEQSSNTRHEQVQSACLRGL